MNGFRFLALCAASLTLVFTSADAGRSQTPTSTLAPTNTGLTNKVYSLADFGHDVEMCKWIAETIPMTVKPESWSQNMPGYTVHAGSLSYFAPGKVMVVNQSAAVHAQIDEFLKSLKKATAQESPKYPPIMPAQYIQADAPQYRVQP